MARLHPLAACAALFALAAPCTAKPASNRGFTLHFICFTATSRPGAPLGRTGMDDPQWLEILKLNGFNQHRQQLPLGSDPDAFISRLQAMDANYDFKYHLAGSAATDKQGQCAFVAREGGPLQFALSCKMALKTDKELPLTQVDIPVEEDVLSFKNSIGHFVHHGRNETQPLEHTFIQERTFNETDYFGKRQITHFICAFRIVKGRDLDQPQ